MKIWKRARKLIIDSKNKPFNWAKSKIQSTAAETQPKPETEPKTQTTAAKPKPELETQSNNQSTAAEIKPKPEAQSKSQFKVDETKPESATQPKTQSTEEARPELIVQSRQKSKAQKTPKSISLETIKNELTDIDDAVVKDFQSKEGLLTVIYLSSLIDPMILHKAIILPLVSDQEDVLKSFDAMDGWNMQKILMAIVNGETVVFHHEKQQYLQARTFSPPERAITSTENETTVLGPQD